MIYDENSLKKDLKAAEKEGYCRCPECGDIVEKIVSGLSTFKQMIKERLIMMV